jgi:hypothetical protein
MPKRSVKFEIWAVPWAKVTQTRQEAAKLLPVHPDGLRRCTPDLLEHQAPSGVVKIRYYVARLKYGIALLRLSRHPSLHDRFLGRYPKIPRFLQRTPDIGILGAGIERNQLHAVRALHLIAVAETWRPLAERLAAFGTLNLYSIGHEILPPGDYQQVL